MKWSVLVLLICLLVSVNGIDMIRQRKQQQRLQQRQQVLLQTHQSVTCNEFDDSDAGCGVVGKVADPSQSASSCTETSGADDSCETVCCIDATPTGSPSSGTTGGGGTPTEPSQPSQPTQPTQNSLTCSSFMSSMGCASGETEKTGVDDTSCTATSGADDSCETVCCQATDPSMVSCTSFTTACGFGKQRGTVSASCRATSGDDDSCENVCCVEIPGIPDNWITVAGSEAGLTAQATGGTVDAFKYNDRMGVYKIMIEKTRASFFDDTLGISEGNFLWGLPIQLFWQMRSKRLNDYTARYINNMKLTFSDGQPTFCSNGYKLEFTIGSDDTCDTDSDTADSSDSVDFGDAFCGFSATPATVAVQVLCKLPAVNQFRTYDSSIAGSFTAGSHSVTNSDFTVTYDVTEITAPDDHSTISPWRWWGGMNYYLSIIPYFGAEKANVVSPLTFATPPADGHNYCTSRSDCETIAPFNSQNAVESWNQYFLGWQTLKNQADAGTTVTDDDMDELRHKQWVAHTDSIRTSIAMFDNEAFFFPEIERQVAEGWACFVEFIAETRMIVDFAHTNLQQPVLPQRILTDCDTVVRSCSPALNNKQQAAVATFVGLYHLSQCTSCFDPLFDGWKNAMSTPAGRVHGRAILEQTFQDFSTFPHNIKQIISDYWHQNSLSTLAEVAAACLACGPDVLEGVWDQTLL